ncbi:MAG: hypothetical protein OSB25_08485 [Salibacteraceae bacterium]|nr:hypothetical protein [Salibacteraceae bacterium]
MDFTQQLEIWAKGDATQGKLMLVSGIMALLIMWLIFKGDNPVLKGMLIPLGIIVLLGGIYGSYVGFSRLGHIVKTQEIYRTNPKEAIAKELEKSEMDNRNYTVIKKIWPVLIIVTALLLVFFHRDYVRGLLIGFLVVFVYGLVVDTLLHQRLKPYLETLQQLTV